MSAERRQVRVLVVDDDQEDWQVIRGLLKEIPEFECIPERAETYDVGVQHFNGQAVDLCLLDYHLGEHDGVALLKYAVQSGCRFPILFVSAEDSVDAVVSAMRAGATNYLLRKNLSREVLGRAIAAALPPERRLDATRAPDFLGEGDRLLEYQIEKVLGHGGFGITYLARDTLLDSSVAIKEYLPGDLAFRSSHTHVSVRSPADHDAFQWGMKHFLKEARTLARFSHPNLVRVLRFFEANATAYFVMEYAHGETLGSVLKREHTLPEERIREVFDPLLDALERVHAAGVLHRDIKPDNIILRADGRPVLIDFGAARAQLGHKTNSLLTMFSAGYTPVEQYSSEGGEQGPWTDIYALGGLAYRCITGHRPDDSVERVRQDTLAPASQLGLGRYSADFLGAVDWALKVHGGDRPRSLAEWRNRFGGPPPPSPRLAVEPAVTRKTPRTVVRDAGKTLAWTAVAVVTLLAGFAALNYTAGKPDAMARVAAVAPGPAPAPAAAPVQESPPVAKAEPAAKPPRVEPRKTGLTPVTAMDEMSAFRDCPNCPEMQVIPSGAFSMGSNAPAASPSEQPVHPVALRKPFAIGRFEVTVGEWAECVRAGACPARNTGAAVRLPVVQVSWHEAQGYAAWLTRHTGRDYRLPTEAAWEYAARSRVAAERFWGDKPELQCRYANGADTAMKAAPGARIAVANCDDGYARLVSTGSLQPNYYDLYDMLGNVWEWTQDCWRDSYSGAPADGSAVSRSACAQRVARGGGWKSPPHAVRAASRAAYEPAHRGDDVGFRVVAN
jgi:formylglycine-generating enzyme required for sulfatase activity/CheY-like chemotaxis protein/predicted Ser/Thr protein kinase